MRPLLGDCGRSDVRVQDFREYWEEKDIATSESRAVCTSKSANCRWVNLGAFWHSWQSQYPDVLPTLDALGRRHRPAIVSNIDDDLLAESAGRDFDLICTAQRA